LGFGFIWNWIEEYFLNFEILAFRREREREREREKEKFKVQMGKQIPGRKWFK
jgi:hypothetical protein